ncbi:hypothetical protein RhiirA1_465911 [Rhizophagus irregularis]|uniref:F-box domain-containing protein n=1 Tax=Rhizophagus irregularis TaxID=588596 RepID=A0A2N0REY4_9GLOM|nr:hypothetical protein RhiirA1_465911 [Rhizophagus irregularis]
MIEFPIDCFNDIVEFLEDDSNTFYSCLLVNRNWCKFFVKIYWKHIRNLDTLISCLPNDSKEILYNNGILISTSKTPLFNYASFCKYLEVYKIIDNVKDFLQNRQSSKLKNLNKDTITLSREIFKLLMCQISSVRELACAFTFINPTSINLISYPGAIDCLKNLSILYIYSSIDPEFLYQLSKICKTIHTLRIGFNGVISNGLTDLISAQQYLRHLYMDQYKSYQNFTDIITLLERIPNSLIKFSIYGGISVIAIPLSFISRFTNLQELVFTFYSNEFYKDFNRLQYSIFPQLQSLKFSMKCPRNELLIKFLENNGKNLKELYVKGNYNYYSLNLAIIELCPNLRNLSTRINYDEFKTLELILINCQYLESIEVFGENYLSINIKDISEKAKKYSPKIKLIFS